MMTQHKALKTSKKAWAGKQLSTLAIIFSLSIALVTGFGAMARVPASAMMPEDIASHAQTMTYEVYAGGIHAVQAKMDVSYEKKDRYDLEFFAETRGFLGKVVPWSGKFETHGWKLKDGSEKPELHKSTATWKSEEDIKEYNYGQDGSFKGLRETEAGDKKPAKSLDKELVQGTTDVLTAMLQVMKSVGSGGECKGSEEVFDGKRRFELIFKHKAYDELTSSRYNVYEGTAARCEVEVVPITGAWHKKPRGWASIQEQGREKGSLPTVWFAKINDKGPAVPVKMRVKTDYGTMFMHLTEYHGGDKTITVSDN